MLALHPELTFAPERMLHLNYRPKTMKGKRYVAMDASTSELVVAVSQMDAEPSKGFF